MHEDQVFDLLRRDLLAAAIDQVLDAPFDHVVARWVLAQQIARAVEAVIGEGARIVLLGREIPPQGIGAAHAKLAHLAERHDIVVLVEQHRLVVRTHRLTHGFQLRILAVAAVDEHQRAFGHAEILLHEGVWVDLPHPALHLGLQALAAAADHPHR